MTDEELFSPESIKRDYDDYGQMALERLERLIASATKLKDTLAEAKVLSPSDARKMAGEAGLIAEYAHAMFALRMHLSGDPLGAPLE